MDYQEEQALKVSVQKTQQLVEGLLRKLGDQEQRIEVQNQRLLKVEQILKVELESSERQVVTEPV